MERLSQKYSVGQYQLTTLLDWIETKKIAVPEIQRPFVWKSTKVRDFLDSLYQGYPVGYIIVWKNPDVYVKDSSSSSNKEILIDGQQRVIALNAALLGNKVINKDYERVNIRIAFNPIEEKFEVSNPAIQKDKSWIPNIAPLMCRKIHIFDFVEKYIATNPGTNRNKISDVIQRLINVTGRQIGVIDLDAELDIETVTEIFIRINSKGMVLSQADFAMSKIASNEEYGGNTLRKAIDYFCHLAVAPEFYNHIEEHDPDFAKSEYFKKMSWLRNENDDLYDPSYNDFLRVAFMSQFSRGKISDLVGLLSGRNFKTKSYENKIKKSSFAQLRTGVLNFINKNNFKKFLMIIESAGFISNSLITSQNALNFAHALYLKLHSEKKYPHANIQNFIRRWFVLSLLTSRYSGSSETIFDTDLKRIHENGLDVYLAQTEKTELPDSFWNAGLIENLTSSNSNNPAFKVFIASQVKKNSRGFLSTDITVRNMLSGLGDIHHIYPRSYLKTKFNMPKATYNQVANYVYTEQPINLAIGNTPPHTYFKELKEQCDTREPKYGGIYDLSNLRKNLAENAIPDSVLDGRKLDYKKFLASRRKLIANSIRDYYKSLCK